MGNLSCLFHGLRRVAGNKSRTRSPTSSNKSADSGFQEPAENQQEQMQKDSFVDNLMSAITYVFFYYIVFSMYRNVLRIFPAHIGAWNTTKMKPG